MQKVIESTKAFITLKQENIQCSAFVTFRKNNRFMKFQGVDFLKKIEAFDRLPNK